MCFVGLVVVFRCLGGADVGCAARVSAGAGADCKVRAQAGKRVHFQRAGGAVRGDIMVIAGRRNMGAGAGGNAAGCGKFDVVQGFHDVLLSAAALQ